MRSHLQCLTVGSARTRGGTASGRCWWQQHPGRTPNGLRTRLASRTVLECQLLYRAAGIGGSLCILQLSCKLLPIRYCVCKLSNLSNLYVPGNFLRANNLDPIGIKALGFNFRTFRIVGALFGAKVMMLGRDVCTNASTTVLRFDAIFMFNNDFLFFSQRH